MQENMVPKKRPQFLSGSLTRFFFFANRVIEIIFLIFSLIVIDTEIKKSKIYFIKENYK